MQSVPVHSLVTPGIGWPLSFCLSFLLLPDREKGWNKPGAGVMIDDTPPLVHTSLLTHCCFSALIGQPCKLPSQCTWGPVLSKPPTTHSEKCASYIVLIKHWTQAPLHVSTTLWSSLLCSAHLPDTKMGTMSHKYWQKMRSYEYLFGKWNYYIYLQKRTSMHITNTLWKGLQTMTKHCNPDKSYLKFPRTVLWAKVLSGARIVCFSWLHQGWLS